MFAKLKDPGFIIGVVLVIVAWGYVVKMLPATVRGIVAPNGAA